LCQFFNTAQFVILLLDNEDVVVFEYFHGLSRKAYLWKYIQSNAKEQSFAATDF
jgi:hypothetical protein